MTPEEFDALLCNYKANRMRLPIFGMVMDVCQALLLRLKDEGMFDHSKRGDGAIYRKAVIEMLLRDKMNIETFILHDYDDLRYCDHEVTPKGKLKSVTAQLTKRKDINKVVSI